MADVVAEEGVPPEQRPAVEAAPSQGDQIPDDALWAASPKMLTPSPLRDGPAAYPGPAAVANEYLAAAAGALAQPSLFGGAEPEPEPEPQPQAEPDAAAAPMIVVVWGGIGAGKSTGTAALLEALGVPEDAFVKVGVDDLVELVPAYRAAVESGDPAKKEAAYMKYRGEAKKLKAPTLAAAIEGRRHIFLEWTYGPNLEKFARGEDAELPFSTAGYDVVLLYVACPDLEGILRNAAKRERTIPPETIRKYNLNRSKHFVEAANGLHGLVAAAAEQSALRAFVMERKTADDAGALSEVTAALPLPASAEVTEEEAWGVVAGVCR